MELEEIKFEVARKRCELKGLPFDIGVTLQEDVLSFKGDLSGEGPMYMIPMEIILKRVSGRIYD
jgi:hypothetical protein